MSDHNAPLIHLHCFGRFDARQAEGAHVLNWGDVFDREPTPRRIPGPAVWTERLWPELRQVAEAIGPADLVRVQGTGALSAGFAVGCPFQRVSRCRLAVAQWTGSAMEWWPSDAAGTEARFTAWELPGQLEAAEGVVIVKALPDTGDNTVLIDVGTFLGEPAAFENIKSREHNLVAIRELLHDGFELDELRDLCFFTPDLQEIHELLTETRKPEAVRTMIDFATRRAIVEPLLATIEARNPLKFAQRQAQLRQPSGHSQKFKAVLLLEADKTTLPNGYISGAEAAALARSSQAQVRAFTSRYKIDRLRLFLAAPLGLAVFLGHQWNAIGSTVQCYEWAGVSGQYLPSGEVRLN